MKIQFRKIESISEEERQALWELFQESYHTGFDEFTNKQQTLDSYALYYTRKNELVGFTGIRDCSFETNKHRYRAIYFGQTVIKRAYRGKSLIQRTVVKLIFRHVFRFKRSKLVVWNDSISYRPYLILAKNLKVYYPSKHPQENCEHIKIRDILGEKYYGSLYCFASGTVRKPTKTLDDAELSLSNDDLAEPDIQFYISKNPNFKNGHGLITFCPATMSNLFFYLRKRFLSHA